MFHSVVIKLTLLYLIIVMAISLSFSFVVYQVAFNEINRGYKRQQLIFEELGRPHGYNPGPEMIKERDKQIAESKENLLWQLLYVNIAILLAGGGISYYFARRTLKPIEEAHQAQSRFAADASHELRSPLSAMKSEIEVALRDKELTKTEAVHVLKSNLEEIERLSILTDGLLELTRGESENGIEPKVSLNDIITSSIRNVSPRAKEGRIEIEKIIEASYNVKGNKARLVQLLTILLDNGIKYSDPQKKIKIITEGHGHSITVKVEDEGFGIKKSDLPHLFDRFYRADLSRTKSKVEGYGLGLSIAQKIAKQHGSVISVFSQAGKGSTFSFNLKKSAIEETQKDREETDEKN